MRCCVIWISRCEKDHTGKSVTLSWSIQMFGVQNSSVHHHFLKTLLFINISTGKVNYLNQFPLHPILVLFYIFLKTSWFKLQLLTAEGQITKQNPSEFVVASFSLLKPRGLWMDLPPQQKTSCPPRADEQRAGHQRDLIGYCFGMFK